MKSINIQFNVTNSLTYTAPAQRVTILDQSNSNFVRQLILTEQGVKMIHGTNVVAIPVSQLFIAAASADPTLTWPPKIITQPTSSTVTHGAASTASFFVSASSELPVTYSWAYQVSGSALPITGAIPVASGSNSASLHINCLNTSPLNSASFVCYMNNTSGATTSSVVNTYIL